MGEPPLAPLDEHVVLLDLEDGVERILLDAVFGQEVLLQLGVCLALNDIALQRLPVFPFGAVQK